jgi:hypothetical protein
MTPLLENGHVEIDNNQVENAIRPTAIGKKNWLFIGDADAGQRSAIIYTIIENCRRRGLDGGLAGHDLGHLTLSTPVRSSFQANSVGEKYFLALTEAAQRAGLERQLHIGQQVFNAFDQLADRIPSDYICSAAALIASSSSQRE